MWSHISIVKRRTGALQIHQTLYIRSVFPQRDQTTELYLLTFMFFVVALEFTGLHIIHCSCDYSLYSLLIFLILSHCCFSPGRCNILIDRSEYRTHYFTTTISSHRKLSEWIHLQRTNKRQMWQQLINSKDWENHLEDSRLPLFAHSL